ncbi:MAG: acetolactate synthase small subunit [Tyzzerella sp.]|uniref:Acetolactate synthase small subunit n=1 Tax=Candidatus Fimicola merdigallinarum TaxID=2840819 RepID=A0A9D9DWZ0_9FIRM|nr:acetolactate synthase small subunit [Candidatus Fimicola merdigallinarum]
MKKRWISLYVENEVGVLAKISGLFSGKSYNLDSLTVGTTEDSTISRMTICLTSDDQTFEQIKKQLNRSVEVIKVVDLSFVPIHMKELMFIRISNCTENDKIDIFRIAQVYDLKVIDYDMSSCILECIKSSDENDGVIKLLNKNYCNRIEVVRGGNVAIEALKI